MFDVPAESEDFYEKGRITWLVWEGGKWSLIDLERAYVGRAGGCVGEKERMEFAD